MVLVMAFATAAALADAELVLSDGQILRGISVELRDDIYGLTLSDGNVLTIPSKLVRELRLTGFEADDDVPATGMRSRGPEVLAGGKVEPPSTAEQLAVLGDPSTFRPGPIDPKWVPSSDWKNSPTLNDFNPAKWYRAPIDPTWKPTSDFTMRSDVTRFSPAGFTRNLLDPFWTPRDGFELRDAFWGPPPGSGTSIGEEVGETAVPTPPVETGR